MMLMIRSDDEDLTEQPAHENRIVTYYRHPFKGNFCVNSFKSAMEIYGLLAAQNSPAADQWYDLALKMHDAPRT